MKSSPPLARIRIHGSRLRAAIVVATPAALALVLALVLALALPTPASAAGEVEVSDDGIAYSSFYPGALFDQITLMVPGDSQQDVFYIRNSGDESGFLRVTLKDVAFTDTDFADALTVTARMTGQQGVPATLLLANPCWVLLEGQTIAPGATVAVTADLALGQLHGQAGQGATAVFAIGVELSDTTAGSLPPTACGSPATEIPAVPGGDSGSNLPGAQVTPGAVTGSGGSESDGESRPEAGGDLPVLNLPGGIVIDPNTWHLYEELLVLVLIAAFVLGSAWFMIVAWRRRRKKADEESEVVA